MTGLDKNRMYNLLAASNLPPPAPTAAPKKTLLVSSEIDDRDSLTFVADQKFVYVFAAMKEFSQIVGIFMAGDVLIPDHVSAEWMRLPKGSRVRHIEPKKRNNFFFTVNTCWVPFRDPRIGECLKPTSTVQAREHVEALIENEGAVPIFEEAQLLPAFPPPKDAVPFSEARAAMARHQMNRQVPKDGEKKEEERKEKENKARQKALARNRVHHAVVLNLDRREDRYTAMHLRMMTCGLYDAIKVSRWPAFDGRVLDLEAPSEELLELFTPAALTEAVELVPGSSGLTPGAIGLLITWHKVLTTFIGLDDVPDGEALLVLEDDARFPMDFLERLSEVVHSLDETTAWDMLWVGFFDRRFHKGEWAKIDPHPSNTNIGCPLTVFGTTGIVVNGKQGARRLLEAIFPVDAGEQFDWLLCRLAQEGRTSGNLSVWISQPALMWSPRSQDVDDSDIQEFNS